MFNKDHPSLDLCDADMKKLRQCMMEIEPEIFKEVNEAFETKQKFFKQFASLETTALINEIIGNPLTSVSHFTNMTLNK